MFRNCFQHLHRIERKRIVMPDVVGMRLNRGERPEPLPMSIQSVVSNALAKKLSTLQQYPSYQGFYEQLARYTGFPVDQIVVGAGIEEFIKTLMLLCCDPGQKAAVLWPTCAMYDIYAKAFDIDLVRIKLKPGNYSMVDVIESIPEDTRVVFIPNPGQPVESNFSVIQLQALADYCHFIDAVLVIDEAHWGFGVEAAFPLVRQRRENVIVMRTFSKFYGAASIRVGYALGQPKAIKTLHAVRSSGEIAGPSLAVASALLDQHELFVLNALEVAGARDWLREEIRELGFKAWGEVGFSLLVQFKDANDAQVVANFLSTRGVLVKVGFPKPVDRCILFTVGSMPLAKRFLDVFEEAVFEKAPANMAPNV